MKYFNQYDDDEDYQDDYSGGAGGGRKKLFQRIRKRMSIVKRNGDDEDDEEDDSYHRRDDDDDEEDEQIGFLERRRLKRQEQQEKKRKEQQKEQRKKQKEKTRSRSKEKTSSKDKTSSSKARPELARRRSLRNSHGEMARFKASRTLRLSVSRDNSLNEEEEDDVAMPLPGHAMEDTPDLEKLLAPKEDEKDAAKRTSSGRRFFGSLTRKSSSRNANNNSSNNNNKSSSNHSNDGLPKSPESSERSRRSRRRKSQSSDRSVDSPPSVASTESSIDNNGAGKGAAQHHAPRRQGTKSGISRQQRGSTSKAGGKRSDDATGAEIEALSPDYYYLSIPWIIKTWIYFLTVVVPFTILYYCLVGIFHSPDEMPFLQKVSFANVMFGGLGCTYRTGFWARQTLDARGIRAVRQAPSLISKGTASGVRRKLPPRTRSGKRLPAEARGGASSGSGGGFKGSMAMPRTPTLRMPRSRRKTLPGGPATAASSSSSPSNNNRFSLTGSLPENTTTSRMHLRTGNNKPMGNGSSRGGSRLRATTRRPSGKSLMSDGSGRMGSSGRSHGGTPERSRFMGGSGKISPAVKSVWDVENMIPTTTKKQSTRARPTMDKHMSIMEIYEVHASDEKNILLQ